jgi:hypothetical protein
MAYPTVSGPYGLIPINLIGGQVFAGATRQIPIGTGETTAIFFGDVVNLNADGNITKVTTTDSGSAVGVFLGVTYVDPTFGLTFRQYYPGGLTNSTMSAYVQDDPDALFKAAVCDTATTTISFLNRTDVNRNAALVQNPGSTTTGNSGVAINDATNTTTTLPVRIIDVVPETAIAGFPGSYTEVIVKWNFGVHRYYNATGV